MFLCLWMEQWNGTYLRYGAANVRLNSMLDKRTRVPRKYDEVTPFFFA